MAYGSRNQSFRHHDGHKMQRQKTNTGKTSSGFANAIALATLVTAILTGLAPNETRHFFLNTLPAKIHSLFDENIGQINSSSSVGSVDGSTQNVIPTPPGSNMPSLLLTNVNECHCTEPSNCYCEERAAEQVSVPIKARNRYTNSDPTIAEKRNPTALATNVSDGERPANLRTQIHITPIESRAGVTAVRTKYMFLLHNETYYRVYYFFGRSGNWSQPYSITPGESLAYIMDDPSTTVLFTHTLRHSTTAFSYSFTHTLAVPETMTDIRAHFVQTPVYSIRTDAYGFYRVSCSFRD